MNLSKIKTEARFFDRSKPDWLSSYEGKVALIKGEKLHGMFDSEENAIREGYRLFGLEPFFVKRVSDEEPVATFPALSIGQPAPRQ